MKPNKASSTAHLIAAGTVFLSKVPDLQKFVPPEWISLCESCVKEYSPRGSTLLRLIDKKWFRSLVFLYEKTMIPGMMLHYILRKRVIEDLTDQALKAGFSQMIVMGGGFDTLAIRLHTKYPQVSFFEMDFPATQKVKQGALEKSVGMKNNFHFIPVDFTTSNWEKSLTNHPHFDSNKKSLFLSEGVLMYLTESEVDRVFNFVKGSDANTNRFIFTFMNKSATGDISFQNATWLVNPWLKAKGEVFKWGYAKEKISDFLIHHKAHLLNQYDSDSMRSRFLSEGKFSNTPIAVGECIALADLPIRTPSKPTQL